MDNTTRASLGKKASNVALVVNVSLMLLKAFTGVVARSTAIIADSFNNGTDIFATLAVFSGLRIAYSPPDEKHHYGHAKAESIVSKIVALIIMLTGITIGWSSIRQILSRDFESPGILALYVSIISIFVKFFLYRYTNKIGKLIDSSSIVADSYNHRSDVLASASALLGVAGARLGYPMLDPIAGLIVSAVIFKTGISIYLESINELMDTAPNQRTMDIISTAILQTSGVININELKARKHGPNLHLDLKICVNPYITVEEGHKIASNTKQNIMSAVKNAQDIMVHVNPCNNINRNNEPQCEECKKR